MILKRLWISIALALLICTGCGGQAETAKIAATTLPVYEFTQLLCSGTDLTVTRLVTENVSCLHDYSLSVRQVRAAEQAEVVIISGAGLEGFMQDVLDRAAAVVDAGEGVALLDCSEEHEHEHGHHHHEADSHIWLSPENAKIMAGNICAELGVKYPQWAGQMEKNLTALLNKLDELQTYGENTLSGLKCREMVTFHDGFSYFAHSFGLTILEAVEEESGSEASAGELVHLIGTVREHDLPAVFTEVGGSVSAAQIIAAETGIQILGLDMAMSGDSYFEAMYHNIDTVKEAMG